MKLGSFSALAITIVSLQACHSSCTEETGAPPVVEVEAGANTPRTPLQRGNFTRMRPTMHAPIQQVQPIQPVQPDN